MQIPLLIKQIIQLPGTLYHKKKSKSLLNLNPTIISSNCFGTFIYHDMGLKFNSPTINLFFSVDDFIKMVMNLPEYMESDVVEIQNSGYDFPVGKISYNGEDVYIKFMHYTDFHIAKEKWNERKKRIDYSNLYIILNIAQISDEYIQKFQKIPYPNKLLVTNENPSNDNNIVTHNIFDKNYKNGKVFKYKHLFSTKRYMDEIDYIQFLNSNNTIGEEIK
ncbi:MAG: DUF1919 domain-containing protein [Clostridia bacterium]|nr:DUF1919 domain-containing protein [Clostridia bacterium]